MKRTLYNSAMDTITMSEQCESRIIDAVMDITANVKAKKSFKIRFIPVIAAAAVLLTGTVTAAADGFEWVKNFFDDKNFEITNDVSNLMGEMSDFKYESNCGIKMSPLGMLADESNLYCMLEVNDIPADKDIYDLYIGQFYTSKTTKKIEEDNFFDYGDEGNDNSCMSCRIEDNTFIFKLAFNGKTPFSSGENITVRFDMYSDHDNMTGKTGDYVKINFDINNINTAKTLEIDYEEPVTIDNIKFKELHVTPLKIFSKVDALPGTYPLTDGNTILKITMKDGADASTDEYRGFSSNWSGGFDIDWDNSKPIDPENIASIYLQGVCLYDCNAQ